MYEGDLTRFTLKENMPFVERPWNDVLTLFFSDGFQLGVCVYDLKLQLLAKLTQHHPSRSHL